MLALSKRSAKSAPERQLLRVTGTVQGVGFRPFIYRLARAHGLRGWVRNDARGVTIEVSGPASALARFQQAIRLEAPPAAWVESVVVLEQGSGSGAEGFVITQSHDDPQATTLISADLPVCPDCLRELFDPAERRYRYPFINCTNCGPRYSIITALPYDRPLTTMRAFTMCPDCQAEYDDPLDRRFHAQPIACPACGPSLRYVEVAGRVLARGEAVLARAALDLRVGQVLAIKGLGGYHLTCDAQNEQAVQVLRTRKYRKEKPFALMARDVHALAGVVELSGVARGLLESPARPIVLLPKGRKPLPSALAPDNASLGVMLPYTPLHHLLFAEGAPELLVMTSANRSSEPIAYQDEEALARLEGLADAFVIGERPIARRVDDSVTQVVAGAPVILRRARGYAPAPVVSSPRFEQPILALGAELKSSVTLAAHGYAFVSQHLGDLSNHESFTAFQETIDDLCRMYRLAPRDCLIVHDQHPAYPSSRYAQMLGSERLAVQHHQAHIASVLAEKSAWERPVLGFSFDGAGLGEDETVWGGEIFHGSLVTGFSRAGQLRSAYLPGGDAAARTPVQAAVGFLAVLGDEALEQVLEKPFDFPPERVRLARQLALRGLNAPRTTSIGRLFDTVAAFTGFRRSMSFEGQAAMWLESLAWQAPPQSPYPFPFEGGCWDYAPLLKAVMDDVIADHDAPVIARRFHEALAQGVLEAALALKPHYPFEAVALSGGVFHNRLLQERIAERFERWGLELWRNQQVPAGDGGISLGQAALAAVQRGGQRCA